MIAPLRTEMDNHRLQGLIEQLGTIHEGQLGFWRFDYEGRVLFTITDEGHDRMRVMTPIVAEEDLTEADRKAVLAANFDRALDAKYATSQGNLWSVFTHPLRPLSDAQFVDAVKQVKTLADNFGTTYTSSELVFGGGNE